MVLSAPAGVVFDLDGTLVLTEERNAQVWRSFLERYDVPLTPERLTSVTGRRGRDSLAELAAELPGRFAGRSGAALAVEVDEVEAQTPLGEVQEVPGARVLVERLVQAGVPLAVCTSATRPYALDCLAVQLTRGQRTAVGVMHRTTGATSEVLEVVGEVDRLLGRSA